jgi:DNA replication protein DnaC
MNRESLEKMRQMRLHGMYEAFKSNLESTIKENLTVSYLVNQEWDKRRNASIARLIKQASFRYGASMEALDYSVERGVDKNQVHRLASLDFIKEKKDLFITGSAGTGKSYLATALGYHACQNGYKVLYASTSKLLGQLRISKTKGTILQDLKKIERQDLLILDDFGLQVFDTQVRGALPDIIEDRDEKRSMIITSQIPVKGWYDVIGEKTIADAVPDRIVHQSLRVELFGESLRRRKSIKDNPYL